MNSINSVIAAIVVLAVLPFTATLLFIRSSKFDKNQLVRGIVLASLVYIGVAMTGVIAVFFLLVQFSSRDLNQAEYKVKIDTWESHPGIREIRAEVKDIIIGIKQNKIKSRERKFDTKSPKCSTYPILYKYLAADKENRPRLLKIGQIISHGNLLTVERYYDKNGNIRFVFESYGTNVNTRTYLNTSGVVIWSVEQHSDEFVKGNTTAEHFVTKPATASLATVYYLGNQSCPEKR